MRLVPFQTFTACVTVRQKLSSLRLETESQLQKSMLMSFSTDASSIHPRQEVDVGAAVDSHV